jgi:nucleoside-diphosphate-sugar epimerase
MRIFVTGATGWVGSVIVRDLIDASHQVTGLVRSPEKAAELASSGAKTVQGDLDDLDLLSASAAEADAVIHTAFNHDFSKFAENAEQDRRVIGALGKSLQGSGRPLIATSGLSGIVQGRAVTETDLSPASSVRKSEAAAQELIERGVRAAVIRLAPSVHGVGEHGFVSFVIRLAREKGVSAYLGDGMNRWAGVHRLDAGRLYRLALEQGATESIYHAVADEGVPFKDIAVAIGHRLGLPVESRPAEHFSWLARFVGADMRGSSDRTRELTGWKPIGPDLLTELDQPGYYAK